MTARPTSAARDAAAAHPTAVFEPWSFYGNRAPCGVGRFLHRREPVLLDPRAPPGAQRAALYSIALFDLSAGPVVVTLPNAGRRQMTLTAMDERHALQAVYHGAGRHSISRERVGARRVVAVFCLMLDPESPGETAAALALQDSIAVEQRVPSVRRRWTPFQPSPAV
jgi:hypothetical protein